MDALETASVYEPAPHVAHTDAPAEAYLPSVVHAVHAVAAVAPVVARNVPGEHAVHTDMPVVLAYPPAAQSWHVDSALCAVAALALPIAHCVHAVTAPPPYVPAAHVRHVDVVAPAW